MRRFTVTTKPSHFQRLAQFITMPTVRKIYTALMVLLAKATDRELARMVSYLKEENRILRARLPPRISTSPPMTGSHDQRRPLAGRGSWLYIHLPVRPDFFLDRGQPTVIRESGAVDCG